MAVANRFLHGFSRTEVRQLEGLLGAHAGERARTRAARGRLRTHCLRAWAFRRRDQTAPIRPERTTMSTTQHSTPASSARWRWLALIAGGVLAISLAFGVYWAQVLRYDADHRRCLRQRQRRADHTADLRHRGGDRRRRHAVREGRPAAGAARSGRCQGGARPGRGAARAHRARRAQPVRHQRAARRRRAAARRPISPRRRAISRAASALGALRRGVRRGAAARRATRVQAAQAALLAARQQLAANRARVDGTTLDEPPAGARRGRRGTQRLPDLRAHRAAGAGVRVRRPAQRAARAAGRARARR